jgi:Amt family ammonium transporter
MEETKATSLSDAGRDRPASTEGTEGSQSNEKRD